MSRGGPLPGTDLRGPKLPAGFQQTPRHRITLCQSDPQQRAHCCQLSTCSKPPTDSLYNLCHRARNGRYNPKKLHVSSRLTPAGWPSLHQHVEKQLPKSVRRRRHTNVAPTRSERPQTTKLQIHERPFINRSQRLRLKTDNPSEIVFAENRRHRKRVRHSFEVYT